MSIVITMMDESGEVLFEKAIPLTKVDPTGCGAGVARLVHSTKALTENWHGTNDVCITVHNLDGAVVNVKAFPDVKTAVAYADNWAKAQGYESYYEDYLPAYNNSQEGEELTIWLVEMEGD